MKNKLSALVLIGVGIVGLVMLKSVLIDKRYYSFSSVKSDSNVVIGNTLLFSFTGALIFAGVIGVILLNEKQ